LAERHKSAVKRHRQSLKKAARNKTVRTQVRHTIRELREVIGRAEVETAGKMLPSVVKTIDKAVTKGVLHRNSASRRISRLSHQVAQLGKAS
jgi:small subunit ribosomal protein S20